MWVYSSPDFLSKSMVNWLYAKLYKSRIVCVHVALTWTILPPRTECSWNWLQTNCDPDKNNEVAKNNWINFAVCGMDIFIFSELWAPAQAVLIT